MAAFHVISIDLTEQLFGDRLQSADTACARMLWHLVCKDQEEGAEDLSHPSPSALHPSPARRSI